MPINDECVLPHTFYLFFFLLIIFFSSSFLPLGEQRDLARAAAAAVTAFGGTWDETSIVPVRSDQFDAHAAYVAPGAGSFSTTRSAYTEEMHERLHLNYLALLEGKRTCLLDKDENAYEEECKEARLKKKKKPSPPRQSGGRLGIERMLPGQTIVQLLEVRGRIRFLRQKFKKAMKRTVLVHREGSPEYARRRTEFTREAIDVLVDSLQHTPGAAMPKVIVEMRNNIERLHENSSDYCAGHQPMSVFGEMIVELRTQLQCIANPGHAFDIYMVARVISLAGMEFAEPTTALLVPGSKSAGKSRAFFIIAKCSPSSMHRVVTAQTAKANLVSCDQDMVNTIVDEAPGYMLGEPGAKGDTGAEIFKSMMTADGAILVVTYCDVSGDDGVRRPGLAVSSCSGTFLVATNKVLHNRENSPSLQRFNIRDASTVESTDYISIENKQRGTVTPLAEQLAGKEQLLDQMIYDAYCVVVVEAAIGANVIANVNMEIAQLYLQMFRDSLKKQNININGAKRIVHLMKFIRTLSIMTAAHYAFRSNETAQYRINQATGAPYTFWEYLPTALKIIECKLICTQEMCVFAFTLNEPLWIKEQDEKITTVAAKISKIRKFFDAKNESNAGAALLMQKNHSRQFAALTPVLQEEAIASCSRGVQQVGRVERAGFAQIELPSVSGVIMSGGANPGRDEQFVRSYPSSESRYTSGLDHETTKVGQFLGSESCPPVFCTVNDDGKIDVNANYVCLTNKPVRTLHDLATFLRDRMTGDLSSAENIEGALRAMQSSMITSEVYKLVPQTGKIVTSQRYEPVEQNMMIQKETRDSSFFHRNKREGSMRSYFYYISTELLVRPSKFRDVFYEAAVGMNYCFAAIRINMVLGRSFVGKQFARRTGEVFGPLFNFHGKYMTYDIEPDANKQFVAEDFVSPPSSDAYNLAKTYRRADCDAKDAVAMRHAMLSFKPSTGRSGVGQITEDPEISYGRERGVSLGYDSQTGERECCWLLARAPEHYDQIGATQFPEDQIAEMRVAMFREHHKSNLAPRNGRKRAISESTTSYNDRMQARLAAKKARSSSHGGDERSVYLKLSGIRPAEPSRGSREAMQVEKDVPKPMPDLSDFSTASTTNLNSEASDATSGYSIFDLLPRNK